MTYSTAARDTALRWLTCWLWGTQDRIFHSFGQWNIRSPSTQLWPLAGLPHVHVDTFSLVDVLARIRSLSRPAGLMGESERAIVVTVKYEDLSAAFDFVSFAAPMEHLAYVSMDTGTIYWISEVNPLEEEIPDDLETSDRYIAIPHKNDLDLGNDLALRFTAKELPDQYVRVEAFFRHRGAYGRFKELLASKGCLDRWYAFEAESTERALRNWCNENAIEIEDRTDEDGSPGT
jgi:hypothetical protein